MTDSEATAIVRAKYGKNWYAVSKTRLDGSIFGYDVGYERKGKWCCGITGELYRRTHTTVKGSSWTSMEEALAEADHAMAQLAAKRAAREAAK